jgi:ribosomal protein S17
VEIVFPSDEAIIEEIIGDKKSWEDMHHRSYLLPKISRVENGEFKSTVSRSVNWTVNHFDKNGVYTEGNVVNILETIPINISKNLDVIENISIGAECSQDDIF